MHWDDWHTGHMGGWMILWWIVIVAVILGVVWFAAMASRRGGDRESPEQVLKRRYAGGEIDRETFERMLEDLRR